MRGNRSAFAIPAQLVLLCALNAPSLAQDTSLEHEVERYLEATDGGPARIRAEWKNGIHMRSEDGAFVFDFNGRILFDLAWRGSGDYPASDTPNEVQIRNARLGVFGNAYRDVIYKLQVDFASASPALRDAYVGLRNLWSGFQFLAGHHKEPFGLEQLTANSNILLMERSAATEAFAPGFNLGIVLSNNAEVHLPERVLPSLLVGRTRVIGTVGVFRTADDSGTPTSDDPSVTARLAWMILQNADSHALVHGAIAYSYRGDDTVRYNDRSGFADTGNMNVGSSQLLALDFAWIHGGFTLAVEYFYTVDAQLTGPNTNFHGGYAKIGYWITGEEQGWRIDRFAATIPARNFFDGNGGKGGFWIGYRFGALDLDDGEIRGGREYTHTIGGIWRWNANTRVMLNYVFQDVRDGPKGGGDVHVVSLRFQVSF